MHINPFREIMSLILDINREFRLSTTSISDSRGIYITSLIGIAIKDSFVTRILHTRGYSIRVR